MTRSHPFETAVLACLAAALVVGIAGARIDTIWFLRVYAAEDGPVEWATAAALLAGAAVSARTWLRPSPARGGPHAITWAGLTLLCLFCAGEEISWGQRILGWSSPAFFLEHNAQHETNLHNLVVAGVKVNRIVFSKILGACAAVYLLVLPVLHARVTAARRVIDRCGVPVARPRHVAAIVAALGLVELIVSGKRYELLELVTTSTFLLILLFPANAAPIRPLRSPTPLPALDGGAEMSRS